MTPEKSVKVELYPPTPDGEMEVVTVSGLNCGYDAKSLPGLVKIYQGRYTRIFPASRVHNMEVVI